MAVKRLVDLLIFVSVLALDSIWCTESPIVETKTGQIRGQLIQLQEARQDVYQFIGIPFAEPPIGERRFKKPDPKMPWSDVLNATKVPSACMQLGTLDNVKKQGGDGYSSGALTLLYPPNVEESEDCLYLNIWVPRATLDAVTSRKEAKPLLAVYVFIHGGGFTIGSALGPLYNGTMLSGFDNIIFASIQYRLGTLGFAYFGENEDAPGNAGLWDQLEGLKWISENIRAFGGNNSEITLGGESAGAASVAFHLLSPRSRSYFQRAIIQSGSAIAPWASHWSGSAKEITDIVLGQVAPGKCDSSVSNKSSVAEKLRCLRSVDARDIALADTVPIAKGYANGAVPTSDGNFVPREPSSMLSSGDFHQIPLLIGANKDEGSLRFMGSSEAMKIVSNISLDLLSYVEYNRLVEISMRVTATVPSPVDPFLFNGIQLHYWPTSHNNGLPKGREILRAITEAIGDYEITCPTYVWATVASDFLERLENKAPIFAYYFTQKPSQGALPEWVGPYHGSELFYVFGLPLVPTSQNLGVANSYDDKQLSKIMMEYWGNFIKYGNPNCRDSYSSCDTKSPPPIGPTTCHLQTWPPYVGQDCRYQIAELNVITQVFKYGDYVSCGFKTRDCLFWTGLFPQMVAKTSCPGTTERLLEFYR